MKGWIKLHRKIQEHWIWADEKYFKYWLIILLNVNHEEKKFPVGGELYTCNPGQSFRSLGQWTALFSCSKPTTKKFLKMLEKDAMISTEIVGRGNRRKHLLTVSNWENYQETFTEKFIGTKPETLSELNPKLYPKCTSNKNDKNEENKRILSQVDKSTLDTPLKSYFDVAFSFWEMFRKNLTDLKISTTEIDNAKFETWVDPVRLLIENDKKTIDEIREVYKFIKEDDFWSQQIRSTAKLRKKNKDGEKYFDKLLYQSRHGKARKISKTNNGGIATAEAVESLIAEIEATQR